MKRLQMHKEYKGQEIIDWISNNQEDPIAIELTRKYYYLNDWFEVECHINPERKYIIRTYTTSWSYTKYNRDSHQTFKIERVSIVQPRRSSLKKGIQNNERS